VYCAGTEPIPSRGAIAATRRQGLKTCQQAGDRRVSASGSGQGPRAPCANSVADKVVTPSVRWMVTDAELHYYK
jgi:hypothetical protein